MCAIEIAGEPHLGRAPWRAQGEAGERIPDSGETEDPDLVIENLDRGQGRFAPPFRGETFGLVQNVAKAQHEAAAPRFQEMQGLRDLAPNPERLLVDEEEIGIETFGGLPDEGRAGPDRLVQGLGGIAGDIVAVHLLQHARHGRRIRPARGDRIGRSAASPRESRTVVSANSAVSAPAIARHRRIWPRPKLSWL